MQTIALGFDCLLIFHPNHIETYKSRIEKELSCRGSKLTGSTNGGTQEIKLQTKKRNPKSSPTCELTGRDVNEEKHLIDNLEIELMHHERWGSGGEQDPIPETERFDSNSSRKTKSDKDWKEGNRRLRVHLTTYL